MSWKLFTVLGAIVLVAMAVGVAGASTPDITSAQTVHLVARGGTSTFVDTGKAGPSIGDEVIINQPLFWASDPDQRAGTGHVIVVLEGKGGSQDQANLILAGGQLSLQGFQAGRPFTLAVTGGTGRYQNARGEADVTLLAHNASHITLELIP
jgi:allene oxide cyclase